MAHPLVHFEIRSSDPDAARAFFGELFGWKFPAGDLPGYTFVETGAGESAIPGGIGPLQGGTDLVTFFIGVDDVDEALAQAERLGGTIVQPAVQVPGVTFALLADPAGHVVGVAKTG
jgi:predicted enzyme related to lactoylglutathione lyase